MIHSVSKPQKRGKLRMLFGKEFFIIKRKLNWWLSKNTFAKVDNNLLLAHSIIKHQSVLLRPLKDVEMYLQHNKVVNLKLAIASINNVVIQPGETCSIWQLVGRPSKAKGYLEGLTLHNGKAEKGTGGGLCQLGNLMYWMALHTPLTIKERWRHGYDVFPDINRTIPFACGATLSYNYIDLQLQNNTSDSFQIKLFVDDAFLHGEIICNNKPATKYEIFETNHMFTHQWWGGYTRHNKIWRKIINNNSNTTLTELVSENSAITMYSPFIEK
jgi:vancomycin resistance protein VanW